MSEFKLSSIDDVIQGILNKKPPKRTKKQQREVDALIQQLSGSKGFCAIQIPVPKKK